MEEKIAELDLLKVAMLTERTRRLAAEAELARQKLIAAEQERAVLVGEQQQMGAHLKETYGLKDGDQIAPDGKIIRAAAAQPPAGPLPAPVKDHAVPAQAGRAQGSLR